MIIPYSGKHETLANSDYLEEKSLANGQILCHNISSTLTSHRTWNNKWKVLGYMSALSSDNDLTLVEILYTYIWTSLFMKTSKTKSIFENKNS